VGLEPAGVVLSAVLQGQDAQRYTVAEGAPLALLVTGEGGPRPAPPPQGWLCEEELGAVAIFTEASAGARWAEEAAAPLVQRGGAADWLRALHPEKVDQGYTPW
jgi:hypothetical protein